MSTTARIGRPKYGDITLKSYANDAPLNSYLSPSERAFNGQSTLPVPVVVSTATARRGSGEEVEIIGMQTKSLSRFGSSTQQLGRRNLSQENLVPVFVTDTMGNPLYLANVAELDDENRVIGGTVTTVEGVAYVNSGRYRISHIGYSPQVVEVGGSGEDVQLMQNSTDLDGVTITVNRPNYWPIIGLVIAAIGFFVLTRKK